MPRGRGQGEGGRGQAPGPHVCGGAAGSGVVTASRSPSSVPVGAREPRHVLIGLCPAPLPLPKGRRSGPGDVSRGLEALAGMLSCARAELGSHRLSPKVGSAGSLAELGGKPGRALGCFPNSRALFCVSGSGKESLDVCGKGGSGGPQRANQRADREELPAGARKHSAKNTCQPGAACPVPSTAADWFPAFLFPVTRDDTAACSAGVTGVRAFGVVRDVIAIVIAGLWTAQSKKD